MSGTVEFYGVLKETIELDYYEFMNYVLFKVIGLMWIIVIAGSRLMNMALLLLTLTDFRPQINHTYSLQYYMCFMWRTCWEGLTRYKNRIMWLVNMPEKELEEHEHVTYDNIRKDKMWHGIGVKFLEFWLIIT